MVKSGSFWDFQGKFFLCPKWGKWVIFGPKTAFFNFSLYMSIRFFLTVHLMTGIKIVLKWPGKFLLCPKWGRWGIFEPKIIILELSVKSMDFSEIKHDKRLKGKFYSTQNGGNRSFLGSKSTFLNISQNLFIRLFWNCTSRQALKSGQTRLLDFEGKLILYSNGLEDQVLEPGVVVVLDYFYFLFCESEQYFLFSTLLEIARHTVKLRRLVSEVLLWNFPRSLEIFIDMLVQPCALLGVCWHHSQ